MIVELPILFTRINTAGTSIALEDAVYARKQARAYARVPSVDAWVRTYMRPSEAEYTAMPLSHFHAAVHDAVRAGARHMFTTISMRKGDEDHAVALLVHMRTGHVEVFDSRGADLTHARQNAVRRGFYTPAALQALQARLIRTFFTNNTHMRTANLEARMARNPPPFPTRYRAMRMDRRYPVLLDIAGACRKGALLYLFYRLRTPNALRPALYTRVKNSRRCT